MTKRFTTFILAAAPIALFLACVPTMSAAIDEELVLSDGFGDQVTIDVSTTNVVTVTCNSGNCGQITQGNVGSKVTSDGADGTISITHAVFGDNSGSDYFTLSDTSVGWGDSTLPTIQNFNQIDASTPAAGSTLTAVFTDSREPNVSTELNIADSNVTDAGISTSTILYTVLTDPANTIPAGTSIYHNTLTGHSNSNGVGGVDVANPNPTNPGDVSVTTETLLTFAGTGTIQANMTVSNVAVPEPAGTVLLGTTILALMALIRKKQAKRS